MSTAPESTIDAAKRLGAAIDDLRTEVVKATAKAIRTVFKTESFRTEREIQLEEAVCWALGEKNGFRLRDKAKGDGAYWWRTELRARAFGEDKPSRP